MNGKTKLARLNKRRVLAYVMDRIDDENEESEGSRCRSKGCTNFVDDGCSLCDPCEYEAMYDGIDD